MLNLVSLTACRPFATPLDLVAKQQLANRYFAIRHGHAISNQEGALAGEDRGTAGGAQDGLTGTGVDQIKAATGAFISHSRLDGIEPSSLMVISSPLSRTLQTAAVLTAVCERDFGFTPSLVIREELRERRYGDLEGEPVSRWNELAAGDRQNPFRAAFEAESVAEIFERINNLLLLLEAQDSNKTFLMVSHCDPIQVMQTIFSGRDLPHYSEMPQLKHAEVAEMHLARSDPHGFSQHALSANKLPDRAALATQHRSMDRR